jgi:hypothetical protein
MQKAVKWADWLDEHFSTVSVTAQGGATPGDGTAMQQVIQEAARIEADSSIKQSGRHQGQGGYSPSQQSGYVPRTITFSTGAGK